MAYHFDNTQDFFGLGFKICSILNKCKKFLCAYDYIHLNEFVDILGDYSDQHGERFHQEIMIMEKRYTGKNYAHMLVDHCWRLVSKAPDTPCCRKSPNASPLI